MLRWQLTINGGMTDFWYDRVGRLTFSRNTKQAIDGYMTYNIYDAQGRLEETGEYLSGPQYSDTVTYSDTMDYTILVDFIRGRARRDVVYTVYDEAVADLSAMPGFSAQEHLRKRISCVNYDPQGNVQTLTQDFPMLEQFRRRYVRVDYDYDVISGKVNMLSYNRGFPDQYYQKYDYDADNRLTEVNTSSDGFIWRRDAKYTYYDHGPLARTEIGDMRVQGMDYAYTIQGWLKAVNGDSLNTSTDIGLDGATGQVTARDAVAHTIDYFTGDYHSITGNTVQGFALSGNLYNGNIAGQSMAIDTFQRHYKKYLYDQLNRIRVATASPLDVATGSLPYTENASTFGYDADGNITQLQRTAYGTASGQRVMDSLNYRYASVNNDLLIDVTDTVTVPFPNDIKHHTGVPGGRYRYDAIGNLTANLESGQDTI
eukprot:gene12532-12319_t